MCCMDCGWGLEGQGIATWTRQGRACFLLNLCQSVWLVFFASCMHAWSVCVFVSVVCQSSCICKRDVCMYSSCTVANKLLLYSESRSFECRLFLASYKLLFWTFYWYGVGDKYKHQICNFSPINWVEVKVKFVMYAIFL